MAAAAALLFWAAYSSRRGLAWRVALVLLAALLLRGDAAWQRSLYPWDERYHARVAKHLAANPLEPTLYQRPLIPSDHRDWQRSHIWLHKPRRAVADGRQHATLRRGRDRHASAEPAAGLGVLSKSLPALLVLHVAFAIFLERGTWTGAFARTAAVALIGALVVAPWAAYAWSAFPP